MKPLAILPLLFIRIGLFSQIHDKVYGITLPERIELQDDSTTLYIEGYFHGKLPQHDEFKVKTIFIRNAEIDSFPINELNFPNLSLFMVRHSKFKHSFDINKAKINSIFFYNLSLDSLTATGLLDSVLEVDSLAIGRSPLLVKDIRNDILSNLKYFWYYTPEKEIIRLENLPECRKLTIIGPKIDLYFNFKSAENLNELILEVSKVIYWNGR